MDLIKLEIFACVYRERSFSRAAAVLGLTQPTVSIHVKEFEAQLGTPLFDRLGREIQPTAAGIFLYREALPLLEQQRGLSQRMAAFLDRIEGPLLIGTSSACGEHLLPRLMMAFQAAHPGVRLKLRFASDSDRTLEELRGGAVELAVIASDRCGDDVIAEPFDSDELVLITATRGPWSRDPQLTLAQLRTAPLILLDSGSATRTSLEMQLARHKLRLSDLNVVAELGRTGAIKEAVQEGYGVAFVSSRAIGAELKSGLLRVAAMPELGTITRPFSVAYARLRAPSPTARAFLEHLRRSSATVPPTPSSAPAEP